MSGKLLYEKSAENLRHLLKTIQPLHSRIYHEIRNVGRGGKQMPEAEEKKYPRSTCDKFHMSYLTWNFTPSVGLVPFLFWCPSSLSVFKIHRLQPFYFTYLLNCLLTYLFIFWGKVSLYSPSFPETCSVDKLSLYSESHRQASASAGMLGLKVCTMSGFYHFPFECLLYNFTLKLLTYILYSGNW